MKRLLCLAVAVALTFSLAACTTSNQKGGSGSTAKADASAYTVKPRKLTGKKLQIGLVPVTMNPSYTMTINGAKEEIQKLGGNMDLIVQAPTSNTSTITEQGNIIESLIQKKVDAIALATESDTSMLPYLREAEKANIPVFLFNMSTIDPKNVYYVSSIGYDQYKAGYEIGQWVTKNYTSDVKAGVLEGYPGVVNTQRMNGFKDALAKDSKAKIVASQVANWTRADGQKVTEGILTAHPEINLLYGPYDEMVLGGIVIVKERNLQSQIHSVGFGCTKDGITAIKNGDMDATINVHEYETGYDIIDAIDKFCVKGETVQKVINRDPTVIDKTNINSIDLSHFM